MLVRVLAEINPTGHADTQSFSVMDSEGETSYVSVNTVDLVRRYTTSDGIDWNIGGSHFDQMMFEADACKKPNDHTHAWSLTAKSEGICDCDFFADGPIFVVTTNKGIHYVVHPDDSHLFDCHVRSKRLKSE